MLRNAHQKFNMELGITEKGIKKVLDGETPDINMTKKSLFV